jgi:hypothetical protein
MVTSAPPPADRRTFWFVYGAWAVMVLQALVFVARYPHAGPIIDEWEFIPALLGEEPFWPWVWTLHNEHRFPLPRLLYYPLFQLTGDFRAGCYVTLAGVAAVALLLIATARRVRGRLHYADAFFPLSLLHVGHWENFRMGYQIVFMMNLAFAAILLRVIVLTNRENLLRRGLEAGLTTLLLLGCGAGGLAFGPFVAVWLLALAHWFWHARPPRRSRVLWLLLLAAAVPVYVWLYLQGYHRPAHHADPVKIWGSTSEAAWQALRSALQALTMAIGPAAIGLWPVSAVLLFLILFEMALFLVRLLATNVAERPRVLGLLLYLGAVAFMGFGIGWGRCVFVERDGSPGFMGLSSRYGWITWPWLGAAYFLGLLYGGRRARWITAGIFGITLAMLPFNVATGFIQGEKDREANTAWEKDVREGLTDEELIQKYHANVYDDLQERMRVGLKLLRKHRVQYYRPLPEPPPRTPPRRGRRRSTRAPRRRWRP